MNSVRLALLLFTMCIYGCRDAADRPQINFPLEFANQLGLQTNSPTDIRYNVFCRNRFGGFLCAGTIEGPVGKIAELRGLATPLSRVTTHVDGGVETASYLNSMFKKAGGEGLIEPLGSPFTEYDVSHANGNLRIYADSNPERLLVLWVGETLR